MAAAFLGLILWVGLLVGVVSLVRGSVVAGLLGLLVAVVAAVGVVLLGMAERSAAAARGDSRARAGPSGDNSGSVARFRRPPLR